jgi:hypothetical protein
MHALIPSHWLSFAVVGRKQRWSLQQTLLVTFLAGCGHVGLTLVLGIAVAAAGKQIEHLLPERLEHASAAIALILLGCYFALPPLFGKRSYCGHDHHVEEETTEESPSPPASTYTSKTVIGTLVMGMTLSPCLDLLSIYVMAAQASWNTLFLLSSIMAVTTLSIMLLLVWLSAQGLQRFRFAWLDHNEGLVMGTLLILLGVLLFLF